MSRYEQLDTTQHMLMCDVFGFYPNEIEVKWYRNSQEETAQVQFTEPHHNGDWSYQILVMLETEIKKGDTFTCEVHHSSLKTPRRVDWHPQASDAAKNKMATGIVGFVLGIVFLIVGLVIYMRGRKAQTSFRGHQNER
ncbi:MHC class II antigen, partial [Pristimantis euphronides]